ncbi:SCO2584 family spore wall biosynthesis protein [Streptomyces sp. 4N509B]|uniref:SCO2584 family spore wall biosynthesis protein n=1 Tax=Streptomyces sp. 4N509B TaxID=3457413 RepID=UPI003FD2179E
MPDDVSGWPFADGEGPDGQERGAADEAFAAVVLDEDFVEAAAIHEPSAAERILYAALERAESEAAGEPPYHPEAGLDPGMADVGAMGEADQDDDEGRFDRSDYMRYLPEEFREDLRDVGDDRYDLGDEFRDEYRDEYREEDDEGPGFPPHAPYGVPAPRRFAGRSSSLSAGSSSPRYAHSTWRMTRWQRPVACVLAVVMGISVIALALIAIQRAGSSQRGDTTPGPASPVDDIDGSEERPPLVRDAELPDDDA